MTRLRNILGKLCELLCSFCVFFRSRCFSLESGLGGSLFSGELLSFLLCYGFADETVFLSLSFETSLSLVSSLSILLRTVGSRYFFAVSLPGVEATFCLSLIESTLLHAAAEMLHEKHALLGEDRTNSVGRLCTSLNPIQSTVEV